MLRPGHAVALCVLALLTIGVVMVNSAGMSIRSKTPMTVDAVLMSRTTIYAGLALAAMIGCSLLPIRRLIRLPVAQPLDQHPAALEEPLLSPAWVRAVSREYMRLWPLWLAAGGLLVLLASVYAPLIANPKNGSHRWINLHLPGLESVQPSELAKWGLVILVAWFAARSASRMKSFWIGLVPALLAIGAVAGFVVIEDLGTGALMVAAATIVLLASGARFWQMLILLPVPATGAFLAIITNPYRLHRLESFMNPYLDPQGKGFHMIQSMLSVVGGNFVGRGLGGSLQKFGYLPEATTDFIFAIIAEELGLAGVAVVLCLLGALVWSIWMIVRSERVVMLKLLALGVLATVGVQAVINLAVVTGLGPTKGIALPLISSGGTGWILTAAALGLVIAIDRTHHAEARAAARRGESIDEEPDLSAVPAFGAVAMSAAAASMSFTEVKLAPQAEALVATADTTQELEEPEPVALAAEIEATAPEIIEPEAVQPEIAISAALVPEPVELAATLDEAAAAEMFEGAVIAEPVARPFETPIPLAAPADAIPAIPGETGLLFDPNPPATPPPAPVEAPQVVVTDHARQWLSQSQESAA